LPPQEAKHFTPFQGLTNTAPQGSDLYFFRWPFKGDFAELKGADPVTDFQDLPNNFGFFQQPKGKRNKSIEGLLRIIALSVEGG
jgi:hypothetical protein